ncbi:MAG: hypothetical protein HFJ53_00240 [Clostridia bacterium]|nr:hypothetical protein [Clostridia bacterium]
METFAEYILSEKDYIKKMEIVYYLKKRNNIFFDNSVIFKTELARMFIDDMNLEVDKNTIITACLLFSCKKEENTNDIEKIRNYAKEGAKYLATLGFDERFCRICEQVNRYSKSTPREPEADILELVDNFGGMLLNRPERKGFPVDEALVLLEYRNLKNKDNKYLERFKEFVHIAEGIAV